MGQQEAAGLHESRDKPGYMGAIVGFPLGYLGARGARGVRVGAHGARSSSVRNQIGSNPLSIRVFMLAAGSNNWWASSGKLLLYLLMTTWGGRF